MAKKLIAVTGIKHNGEEFAANEELDTSKFTKDELKSLHDAGAVRVDDDGKATGPDTSAASPENPQGQDAQAVGDVPASAKEAPTKATPAKATGQK
jgi:hypothetical protein